MHPVSMLKRFLGAVDRGPRVARAGDHGAPNGIDVVRIEIGHSIVDAERIAQLATASGLHVQLLRNEHPETGSLIALGSCVLLVSRQDEAALRDLLADFGYQA